LGELRKAHRKENFRRILDSSYAQVKRKSPIDRFQYFDYLAWYYHASDKKDTALIYADSMLSVLARVPHVEDKYVKALITKGILLKSLNLYPEALQEFYSANVFAERFLDQCEASEVYINLGAVLFEQKSYFEGLNFYIKAEQAAWSCDSTDFYKFYFPIQFAINAQGLCYENLGQHDSAILKYEYGLEFLEEYCGSEVRDAHFSTTAKGVFYGNLGNAYLAKGDIDQAIVLLEKSIELNLVEGRIIQDAIYSKIKLGKAYLIKKDQQSLKEIIDTVHVLLKKHPDIEARIRLLALEHSWQAAKGEKGRAYELLSTKLQLMDSVEQNRKALSNINIPTSYSYLQQKAEYERLRRTQNQYYLYLILAGVLIISLISIVWLSRRNLKNTKKNSASLSRVNTELTESNERLRGALNDLESSQAENSRIMKVVAHDLRSPISGAHLTSSILLERNNLDKESRNEVQLIHSITRDSLGFIDQLLGAQEADKVQEKEETDLLDLIDYCVNYMRLKAEEKEQTIQVHGEHLFLPIYREKVWRVLNNLIYNAIKFSPKGGSIDVYLAHEEKGIKIRVVDSGMGMSDKVKKEIFNQSERGRRKGTSGERSYGLGLAICMQVMQEHSGSIRVESEQGCGSEFILLFPK